SELGRGIAGGRTAQREKTEKHQAENSGRRVLGRVGPVGPVGVVRERGFAIGVGRAAPELLADFGAFAGRAEIHRLSTAWAAGSPEYPLARSIKLLCKTTLLQKRAALALELPLEQVGDLVDCAKHRVGSQFGACPFDKVR